MTRDLINTATEKVEGSVSLTDKKAKFVNGAVDMFRRMRGKLGDEATAKKLLADGWSNGYFYLSDTK